MDTEIQAIFICFGIAFGIIFCCSLLRGCFQGCTETEDSTATTRTVIPPPETRVIIRPTTNRGQPISAIPVANAPPFNPNFAQSLTHPTNYGTSQDFMLPAGAFAERPPTYEEATRQWGK